jgi:NADPH:quinone reductase
MRAIEATTFGGPEVLVLHEVAAPGAGRGQAVVDVSVIPVLFLDTQIRQGAAQDWFATTPPYVPGTGVAGTVSAVGEGVQPDWVGRRVVAATEGGSYREQAVVSADGLIEVPEALAMADAAALFTDGRTAMGLIEMANLEPKEWVLVLGAGGGLGCLLVQLAHGAGARVIGAAGSKEKLDLAQELGSDVVVDYSQSDWPKRVLDITDGVGLMVVCNCSGGGRLSGRASGGTRRVDVMWLGRRGGRCRGARARSGARRVGRWR